MLNSDCRCNHEIFRCNHRQPQNELGERERPNINANQKQSHSPNNIMIVSYSSEPKNRATRIWTWTSFDFVPFSFLFVFFHSEFRMLSNPITFFPLRLVLLILLDECMIDHWPLLTISRWIEIADFSSFDQNIFIFFCTISVF